MQGGGEGGGTELLHTRAIAHAHGRSYYLPAERLAKSIYLAPYGLVAFLQDRPQTTWGRRLRSPRGHRVTRCRVTAGDAPSQSATAAHDAV